MRWPWGARAARRSPTPRRREPEGKYKSVGSDWPNRPPPLPNKQVGVGHDPYDMTRERTAYHEAGHAVVAWSFAPHSVRRVTIQPDGDRLGKAIETLVERLKYFDAEVSDHMRVRIEQKIITALAGAQAE